MTNIQEIWKEIPHTNGYFASNLGRIKSPDRYVNTGGNSPRFVSSIIVSEYIGKDGYSRVSLRINGKEKKVTTHRMICLAFHPIDAARPIVNHKNAIKHDNRADNLEWCTQSENLKQGYDMGNREPPMGMLGKTGDKCVLSHKIICVNSGKIYGSIREASREIGISDNCITNILKGKSKLGATKTGLIFKYF